MLGVATVMVAAVAPLPCARAEPEAILQMVARADGFAFDLLGAEGSAPWLLQHSRDGRGWEDLIFLEGTAGGRAVPGVEVRRGALPVRDARRGFFRAVQLASDEPLRRRYLEERVRWRLSGFDRYQYQLRQNFGSISWLGAVVVVDDEVASFETIELQPPEVEVPEVPTIDRLFDRIADAIARDAESIEVTWHPEFGFPSSCYIDYFAFLADEEQGWTIDAFTPSP